MRRLRKLLVSCTAIVVVLGTAPTILGAPQGGPSLLQLLERDVQGLVDRLQGSIVTIRAISQEAVGPAGRPDAMRGSVVSTFVGSGIVLDTAGHILTTALVVEGRDRFLVELPDRRVYEAALVGKNSASDVAILQTRAVGLVPPAWGNSDSLRTGSIIIVLGNSYGCPQSVSLGAVDGYRPDGTTIQMHVDVSAGTSGGAVVNSSGAIVGLVKAKVSEPTAVPAMRVRSADNPGASWYMPEFKMELPTSGVALAVPINIARSVAERIIGGGGEEYPFLGVYVTDVHSWLAKYYHTDQGVVVGGVVENTPAAKYGLQGGDLIRTFNSVRVQTVRHFRELVGNTRPGERVLLDILRSGTTALKVSLVMGRAETPHYMEESIGVPTGARARVVEQPAAAPGILRPDDSMSVDRLNEIRRRIIESADSLNRVPVNAKPQH